MLSIIIPTYNSENTIIRCLDSIINQTYKDFEIIIIDDESKDNTINIIEDYINNHKEYNINLYKINHSGSSFARKQALNYVKGEYISFIDSDDYIDKNYYELLVDYNYDLICSGLTIQRNNKSNLILNSEEVINDNELLKHLKKYLYSEEAIYQYLCNKIFKKELFDNIYFPDDMIGEDFIVITQILDKINNIKLINNTAYYYDLTSESQSKEKYSIKHKNMYYEFKKYYEANKDKEYNLELKNYIYKHYLAILVSMSKSNDYPLDLEEEIIKFIKDNKDDYLRYSNDNITFKIATRLLCRNKNLFYKISRYLYKYL